MMGDYGVHGSGFFVGGWTMWIVWIILIGIVVYMVMATLNRKGLSQQEFNESPQDILKKRFARGEIDETEYQERLHLLNNNGK